MLRRGGVAIVPGANRVKAINRGHRRAAAGGDDDRPTGAEQIVTDPDPTLAVERSAAAEELDPTFLQPGQLPGVVAVVNYLIATLEHRARIEPLVGGNSRHSLRLGEQVGRAQQCLRRHAGVVGALAADQVLPDDRHREPAVGQPPGADLARGPGAEHDRVELPLAHSCIPTRLRTIAVHSTGATGFDVVGPCERLQVEVAGGLVKPRHQPIRADHEFALAA